jgi:hypothetical protein
MKTSFLTPAFILYCCTLFAQNENPYAQFGYQAAMMPEPTTMQTRAAVPPNSATSLRVKPFIFYPSRARYIS